MSLCASVYMCFVVTCWERADLLALVCGVYCEFVTFPLVSWVRCGTWLYRFLIFAPLLTLTVSRLLVWWNQAQQPCQVSDWIIVLAHIRSILISGIVIVEHRGVIFSGIWFSWKKLCIFLVQQIAGFMPPWLNLRFSLPLWVVSPFLCFIIVRLFDYIVSLWWYMYVHSKAVVLLLLIRYWLSLPLWDSVIVLCFVVRYLVSILVYVL